MNWENRFRETASGVLALLSMADLFQLALFGISQFCSTCSRSNTCWTATTLSRTETIAFLIEPQNGNSTAVVMFLSKENWNFRNQIQCHPKIWGGEWTEVIPVLVLGCAWGLLKDQFYRWLHKQTLAATVFRPSATVSRIGLMESRLHHCHCRGGPPPPG